MTVDEKGLAAAIDAYVESARRPWRDAVLSVVTAYEYARSAEPVASEQERRLRQEESAALRAALSTMHEALEKLRQALHPSRPEAE